MTPAINQLKFSSNNRKLKKLSKATGKKVYGFDLPAGWSCPGADECLSKAHKSTGKITDGANTRFRCYAASLEAAFPQVRSLRWHNFDLLRGSLNILTLLTNSLPSDAEIIRIHSSGDFFNMEYLQAWASMAVNNPSIIFYGYTKRADLFSRLGNTLPPNMRFVKSVGGRYDHIDANMTTATVVDSCPQPFPVFSTDADSELHVIKGGSDFGLLIHGTQPKGWTGIN